MNWSLNGTRDRSGHAAAVLLAVVLVWAGTGTARSLFALRPGLRADYFGAVNQIGEPARSRLDAGLNTSRIASDWGFLPPDAFSVRWSGYLFTTSNGTYTFSTSSDDGSEVYVDGHLVVDNSGTHGAVTKTGQVHLARGPHALSVTYENMGGAYEFAWAWGRDGETLRPVPSWRLSPQPRGYVVLLFAAALDWLWPLSAFAALALALWLVVSRRWWPAHDPARGDFALARKPAAVCLAVMLAATLVQTWPLVTNPAHLSRNDNADTKLNEWAIAWVAHELPRAPLRLFDANMFYPERHTLAYSETLFVQGVMAAPLLWLGASPVLAYNIVLIAGFTLSGWAMCLVVARWTEDWIAGVAAGLMLAFNAHTLTRLPHLQAQHTEFLPLALLAFDALLRRPRWRTAVWLAVSFALQALTSVYLLVFTTVALGVGFIVRPEDWANRRWLDVAPKLLLAAGLAVAILAPFLLPYWQLRNSGFTRSLDEAAYFAATFRDYYTTQGRFHTWTGGGSALFPGFAAVALTLVALLTGVAFRDARARMCFAFGICGVVLSLGPAAVPGFATLFSAVPLFQGLRTTSRFGYLGLVAVAVLGGYGLAALRSSLRGRHALRFALSGVALTIVFLDPFAAPIFYAPFDAIPAIYRIPSTEPNAVVAELPLAPPERQYRDASALLDSTLNWRPLVNGYSGFTPPGYVRRYAVMNAFPAHDAIAALGEAGVTDLFVHTDQYDAAALATIRGEPSLREVASDGPVVLYALDGASRYR
jgi:hypothetical protein